MIRDLDQRTDELPTGGYDLCIVGSGPAGASLARELAGSGLRVCVLESGLDHPTRRGDELRATVSSGIHLKDWSRERVLGGASSTWAGLSSPMDPVDLGPRPYAGTEGWPLDPEELARDYEAAAARFRFPDAERFGPTGFGTLRAKMAVQPAWTELEEKVFLACDEPQRFGSEWLDTYDAGGVDLWLDATVERLERSESGGPLARAHLRTRSGERVPLTARAFVLACGGIENARLLLLSDTHDPAGLGNAHDQVGRCLMNHPKSYHGVLRFARPQPDLPYWFGCMRQGFAGYAGLRLPLDLQRERGLLNSYVRLEPLFPWTDSRGVEALVTLVKHSGALFRSWKRRRRDEVVVLRDYSETGDDSELQNQRRGALGYLALVGLVLADLPRVLRYAWHRVSRRPPAIRAARVRNFMEMAPDPDNRVTLDPEARDVDGRPLPRVHHACGDLDRASMVAVHEVLARELERTGLGTLEDPLTDRLPWPIDQDASHHMGTTRMGTDPTRSVTDPDLRVHDVPNLYLAGASVFPTSGCANPTFTIVALSIRLARHLRGVLAED